MAYTTINNGKIYFNTKLYTGNGSTQSITGVGFQPDFTWIKRRDGTAFHVVTDSVRGATKQIYPNDSQAEGTRTQGLQSFNSDGYTLGNEGDTNASSSSMASWNWLGANGTASNSDGSITSTVSANTTAGFSIVSYTGTGSNLTAGHGLGSVVKMFFVKELSNANSWEVYHVSQGAGKNAQLNTTAAFESAGSSRWNSTAPTSTTISIGTDSGVNRSSSNYIAYCFAEKKGYSKIDSYIGNNNNNGAFIYTGFAPSFVMIKNTQSARDWMMFDNKRTDGNPNLVNKYLIANGTDTEGSNSTTGVDFLSNGFKCRNTFGSVNHAETYIYIAFAENPFTSSAGTPVMAR